MGSGRLKPGWTQVAFGDVVQLSRERSTDPESAGLKCYVGLEHLDPGDLAIRRWGRVATGTTFTSVFRPGQVLFGKRRAYQRKVAVSDFSGVCSGDIYVLESRTEDRLLPGLLPFICQTEAFFQHAIGTSAGSLSPRTNWQNLAAYELALPPLDEQRRIAALLRSHVEARDASSLALGRLDVLLRCFIIDAYASLKASHTLRPTTSLGVAMMGRQKAPKYCLGNSPSPYMKVANIGALTLRLDKIETMDFTDAEMNRYRLVPGDILLTEGDIVSPFNVGRPAIYRGEVENCAFQNHLIRLRPASNTSPMFALLLLEGARLNHVFAMAAKTTTITSLGLGRFRDVMLPIPNRDTQNVLANQLSALLRACDKLTSRVRRSVRLGRALLAEVLDGRGGTGRPAVSA